MSVSTDDLARAEAFAREPFVLDGEDPQAALADGGARRMALDAALREIAEGRRYPSLDWRRDYSLILGLERLLAEEEPHLADGTVLSAHQVDALSGTLIALESEIQASRNGGRPNGNGALQELSSDDRPIEGEEELSDEE